MPKVSLQDSKNVKTLRLKSYPTIPFPFSAISVSSSKLICDIMCEMGQSHSYPKEVRVWIK